MTPNATAHSEAALGLVYQAAQVVKGIEDSANETKNIAERALEQLQLAQERILELEAEQRAAQACIKDAQVKIREAREALELERLRADAAESQRYELEPQATTDQTKKIADRTLERLQLAQKRILELEAEQQAARVCIKDAQVEIHEAREALKLERLRADALENQRHELQPHATTAAPGVVVAGGMAFAALVRRKIADTVTYVQSNVLGITASSGVSDLDRCNLGWTEILARADVALNDAKASGPPRLRQA